VPQGPRVACPLCQTPGRRVYRLEADVHRCVPCALDFAPGVGFDAARSSRIDEAKRRESLRSLRMANFARILERLLPRVDTALPGLEVGSAYGWFQQAARDRGVEVLGVEPDAGVAACARAEGFEVRDGFFSEALFAGREAGFGFVALNDVLEHLPDLPGVLATCHRMLAPDGLVVVNLPLRDGIFYRLAVAAYRLGIDGPLTRLWNFGFASPHLWYFSRAGIERLLETHGFSLVEVLSLRTLDPDSLEQRIAFDRSAGAGTRLLAAALRLAMPVLSRCPADVGCFLARKR
jgi:SAM-dependent methyltransferase